VLEGSQPKKQEQQRKRRGKRGVWFVVGGGAEGSNSLNRTSTTLVPEGISLKEGRGGGTSYAFSILGSANLGGENKVNAINKGKER